MTPPEPDARTVTVAAPPGSAMPVSSRLAHPLDAGMLRAVSYTHL